MWILLIFLKKKLIWSDDKNDTRSLIRENDDMWSIQWIGRLIDYKNAYFQKMKLINKMNQIVNKIQGDSWIRCYYFYGMYEKCRKIVRQMVCSSHNFIEILPEQYIIFLEICYPRLDCVLFRLRIKNRDGVMNHPV